MEKRDVFISHASEDKQNYVYPLAHAFKSIGITYWLDEAEIKWGESILKKINEGLNSSRYVLVLLTEPFISKPWTQKELNVALHHEIDSGEVVVLPVLIASREVVLSKLFLMKDKRYLEWKQGPEEIAKQLLQLLGREYKKYWEHNHPAEYSGKIWIRITPKPSTPNVVYQYAIIWGPWEYKNSLTFKNRSCISLWHTKGKDGRSLPLFFSIFPECYVTFGIGEPLDDSPVNINAGWKFTEKQTYNFVDRLFQKGQHFLQKRHIKTKEITTSQESIVIKNNNDTILESVNMGSTNKIRILFLGANPSGSRLKLDEEVRRIQTNLKLAKERENLELQQEWAVTTDTLMQSILDGSPTIIHFSGHGKHEGIILQDEIGNPKLVTAEALSSLFKLFKNTVKCVVLNSCYSQYQAEVIKLHISYVIGMKAGIPDQAAISFSTGFYKAIGAGKDIPFAFELGKAAIQLEGILSDNIPILL